MVLLSILHLGKVLKKLKLDTLLRPEGSVQPTINQRLSINNYNDGKELSKVAKNDENDYCFSRYHGGSHLGESAQLF
jgi:hypothetical protein